MKRNNSMVFICVMVLAVGTTLSGCESFHKKFVRQKKKTNKEEFVPVLDPIEYPAAIHSPEKDYKKHYGLWKAWHKELVQEIATGENDKRQKYLLNECVAQLEEMKKLIAQDRQVMFKSVLSVLDDAQKELDKPEMMRQANTLKKSLERTADDIMNSLNPEMIKNYLVAVTE